jgi:putative sugar O-methyltransferase
MIFRRIIQFVIICCRESFSNIFYLISNQSKSWTLDLTKNTLPVPQGSSVSDSVEYISFLSLCSTASLKQEIFEQFRSNLEFQKILEHVDYWRGYKYINKIRTLTKVENNFHSLILLYDSIGNPKVYKYRKIPACSPTLLRYISVYFELKELFGTLDNKSITEIGVGYGGQSVVVNFFDRPLLYTLIDLPEVLELAQKFTFSINHKTNYNYLDGRNPIKVKSDLVVSNYAFSELERSLQIKYLNNILRHSSMGYITWNNLSFKLLGGLSVDEILAAIPNARIIDETPLTAPGNMIIVWGTVN